MPSQLHYRIVVATAAAAIALVVVLLAFPSLQALQTLIVGIAGFGGVAWTLADNARLSREQHERQIGHEREVLRIALRAELRWNLDSLDHNRGVAADAQSDNDLIVPLTARIAVYDRLVDRIGLLRDDQVYPVIDAYLTIASAPDRIRLMVTVLGGRQDPPIINNCIIVPASLVPHLRDYQGSVREAVAKAVTALND